MEKQVRNETRVVERRSRHGASIPLPPDFVRFEPDAIEKSIPDRFEQQVEAYATRLAVKSRRHALSYEALNRLANRVARALLAIRGTGSEPVALLLEKDAPHLAAILGVLKAGKFYVPLAPSYPIARNALILSDTQSSLIVTDQANLERAHQLSGDARAILNLDALDPALDDSNLGLPIAPDTPAYLIYTSGTTGQPKGSLENHRNVLHNILNLTNDTYINKSDRITGLSSFAFSGSLKDVFGSLLNGAALFPMEIEQVGMLGLAHWLVEEQITIFSSVTTTFRHFAMTLNGRETFPRLRLIRIGSEEVTWKDIELFKEWFPESCVLVNGYGATETGSSRIYVLDHQTPALGTTVPVGYPVEGMEVLLLDDAGERVGPHEVGEIAVRSAYLSPGYWRQPELTRAAFRPDPEGDDRRTYLTGDLGVMEPDGCLTHVGRKDFQVKVRGNRVELAEIEAVLRQAPGIKEVVVSARAELPKDHCLVAYVVPFDSSAPRLSPRGLRTFLRDRLPDASIPSAFVTLDALPLTSSGKIDRKGLPAPNTDRSRPGRQGGVPRTELEEQLVEIWEELIGLRPIGVHDDFFEIGGHSLLAARLYDAIRESFGRRLPFETLLSAPTIETLAEVLSDVSVTTDRSLVISLRSAGSRLPFFCLPGSGGHALSLYDLARFGDPDQPFFGLELPEPDPGRPGPDLIEDMAARLLAAVRKIQPAGPYRLGGYSFGGVVAYELAQQLRAQGQDVSLLVLIDTWGKGYPTVLPLPERLLDHIKKIRTLDFREKCAYVSRKTAAAFQKIARKGGRIENKTPGGVLTFPPGKILDRGAINHNAWVNYVPRVYPGRLTLLRAEEQPDWAGSRFDDPSMGWNKLAAEGVEVHPIPGTHLTLFDRPNVGRLAETLSACLRQ